MVLCRVSSNFAWGKQVLDIEKLARRSLQELSQTFLTNIFGHRRPNSRGILDHEEPTCADSRERAQTTVICRTWVPGPKDAFEDARQKLVG